MSEPEPRLKPLFLIKPKTITRRDILRAERLSGICIIECAEPEAARFCDLPLESNLDDQARAALSLLRIVVRGQQSQFQRGELTKWFIEALMSGNKPASVPPVPAVAKK